MIFFRHKKKPLAQLAHPLKSTISVGIID